MAINLYAHNGKVRVGRLLYTREEMPEVIEALTKWAKETE